MSIEPFRITEFESLCYRRDHERAKREMQTLFERAAYREEDQLPPLDWSQSGPSSEVFAEPLATRLVTAITALATDAQFSVSNVDQEQLTQYQHNLSAFFAVTALRNADHILRMFALDPPNANQLDPHGLDVRMLQLFYFADSQMQLDWDELWAIDKATTANLAISLLSVDLIASPEAHQKREMLLGWLPDKLEQMHWDQFPAGVLHKAYKLCSYALLPSKHLLKKSINAIIVRKLASLGIHDVQRKAQAPEPGGVARGKPVMLVGIERFALNHQFYHMQSQPLVAMRERFHLIGMGLTDSVDQVGRELFHEFIPLEGLTPWEQATHIREVSQARLAQVLYMPSVGMLPFTMVLANLRVAPLQMMALGHPATTHGHAIDFIVVEEDFVGKDNCFSEKLLKLPAQDMPYRPHPAMKNIKLQHGVLPPKNDPALVRVAVPSNLNNINPVFLELCTRIAKEAKVSVEFQFLVSQVPATAKSYVTYIIQSLVGNNAVVRYPQSYENYMNVFADCDLFLNPFPFGSPNVIVDGVWAGLIGVCKTGAEVHEHINEGIFRRLGFPQWTIAQTPQDYQRAALRMINDGVERRRMAELLSGEAARPKLFPVGRPEILGENIEQWWKVLLEDGALPEKEQEKEQKPDTPPTGHRVSAVGALKAPGVPEWLAIEVEDYFAVPLHIDPKVIIDIGANIGAFSLRAHKQWPQARVLAFEPVPSNVASLRANLDTSWAEVFPCAVRALPGTQEMFLGDMFVTGSFEKGDRQTANRISVDCVASRDLPACDLIKIDTEGSEVEILSTMNLETVKAIVLEYHSFQDARTLKGMLEGQFKCLHDKPSGGEVGTLIFERIGA